MKAKDIISILDKLAPPFLIDSWDNSGLQIGSKEEKIQKILISLDLSKEVLRKAIEEKVDMIITHHPFIFEKLSNISMDDEKGKIIRAIIKNDITVFSLHTNLDICEGGVSDILCKLLDVDCESSLSPFNVQNSPDEEKRYGYGRIGKLNKEMTLKEFSKVVNDKLKCKDLRIYGNLSKKIEKIAVCGGSGAGFIKDAHKEDVDVYVTGDIKYHDAQLAKELDLAILDAGHYETELPVVDFLKQYINDNSEDLEIITYKESLADFTTLK